MKAAGALVLLLALSACSGTDDDGDPGAAPSPSGSSSAAPSPAPTDPADLADLADTDVCARVRDGIDQFNLGDLEATIAAFEDAIAPAEELAEEQPSEQTETLLDAVRYYAELPAADYVEANRSSPEFLRYKTFTLTECAYAGPPGQGTAPAIPA